MALNYPALARRYLPLAAVVAVQLLIIAVVPSKATVGSTTTATAGGPVQGYSTGGAAAGTGTGTGTGSGTGTGTGTSGAAGATPGTVGTAGSTSVVGGATVGSGTAGGGTGSSTAAAGSGGAGAGGGGASASGGGSTGSGGGATPTGASTLQDTSHCSGNREFSPAIDYYAPPCTPGSVGGAFPNNGGSTGPGVSGNTVTIVDYISNYGAEVNTILQAEGLLETYQDGQVLDHAFQNFINSHYVLWGRHINLVPYQGKCQSVPPDYSCLLAEMDSVVSTYHPYAVYWNTTLCSACFARLASDHVVAFGGAGFSDAFSNANAPYYYSEGESSTRIEQAFADFYCNQLNGKDAVFAQRKNPAQDFTTQQRVLGIISTNDPDNEDTVKSVLVPALQRGCGVTVNHFYFYDQNINTAAQQVEAGISAMDTTANPATDVLCLCDPVAPEFLYEGEEQHNYWPENLIADVQEMSTDSAAQNYGPSSSISCPTPSLGCPFDNAFGISFESPQENQDNNAAVRVFKMGGGTTLPVTGIVADTIWESYNMMASLIENTGPDLVAARMQAAAPSMGSIGGGTSGHYQVGFAPGDWQWVQDAEVAYWSKNGTSPYNGKAGTWVPIEGQRFLPNQYPQISEPPIPANR